MSKKHKDFKELSSYAWGERDYAEYCGRLAGLAEDGYREFVMGGTPTERPLLGVRTPVQRGMAEEIYKGFIVRGGDVNFSGVASYYGRGVSADIDGGGMDFNGMGAGVDELDGGAVSGGAVSFNEGGASAGGFSDGVVRLEGSEGLGAARMSKSGGLDVMRLNTGEGLGMVRLNKSESLDTVRLERFLRFTPTSFEEVNVRGFVIARSPYGMMLRWLPGQINLIDNWGNCDCFCASLKSVRKNLADFLENFIRPVVSEEVEVMPKVFAGAEGMRDFKMHGEFAVRTGLVCLLDYYVVEEYLAVIFDLLPPLFQNEEYYVQMGVAWLVATCFAKFPEETYTYLQAVGGQMPRGLLRKTLQKVRDSRRVEEEWKERLRELG